MAREEPWLRGPLLNVSPLLAPMLCGFEQAREDLTKYTAGLTAAQIWARSHGLVSLGFHLRHIAGSVDRLTTYLQGGRLSEAQLRFLAREAEAGDAGLNELLGDVDTALRQAEGIVRSIDVATLAEARTVGRKQLPTTVIGLLVHIAEHTQRHVGQAIVAANLARAVAAP